MGKNLILRTQANVVLEMIKSTGLDPSGFEWREVISRHTHGLTVSTLFHKASGYYFIFDYSPRKHNWCEISPGTNTGHTTFETGTWEGQLSTVGAWLVLLRSEIWRPLTSGDQYRKKHNLAEQPPLAVPTNRLSLLMNRPRLQRQ